MSWLLLSLLASAQEAPMEEATVDAEPEVVVATPDRSRLPDVTPPTLLPLPQMQELPVVEGITAYIVPVEGVRKVDVTVYLHRGGVDFEGYVSVAHEANGWLQDIATGSRSAGEIAVYEDYWDSDVWTSSGGLLRQTVNVSVPAEDLDRGLDLLTDIMVDPKYPGREIKVFKNERFRYYMDEAVNSPSAIASSLRDMGWYTADSAYGTRPDLDAVAGLTRGDLRARHADILGNAPISVLVVGDVNPQEVVEMLRVRMGEYGTAGEESERPGFSPAGDRRILAVDMPDAEQASVLVRMPAPLLDANDRVAFSAVSWAYGGHFMSRINANLREDKGITYGAGARYRGGWKTATFDIGVDVPAEHVQVAMTEIEAELAKLAANGMTDSELSAKSLEDIGWWNSVLQTSDSASSFYQSRLLDGEDVNAPRGRIEALQGLTPADTQATAQAWLGEDSARLWAVVGPRSVIEEQLEAMNLPIQWVEPSDAIMGNFE